MINNFNCQFRINIKIKILKTKGNLSNSHEDSRCDN